MSSEEIFDLVNEAGEVIGQAPRSDCHGNPDLMHQAVHVMVMNDAGRLFLQKRSMDKDIQPGKWDTSVGGHLGVGESAEDGARREVEEELGFQPGPLTFAYSYIWRSPVETELIRSFSTHYNGPVELQASEIDEGRFWSMDEIAGKIGQGIFTPNFELEFDRFRAWLARRG